MKKRERQFQTIGVRMRDFGRGIMRHYVPQQQFPAQREAPPPNWQAEIETPLLWEESVLPAPEAAPPVDNITPPLPASEPTPQAAPKPVPAAPEKPIQRQSAPPQPPANAPKFPASLLKLAEEGRKRDVQREEIRQDKLAKFSEQLSNADPEAAAQIRRRRGKMSVNYVDTKPLSQGEELPIQRQSEPVQPVPEPDEAEPVEDVSATNAETAIETGDALLPADASSQASDTPVVDSLQRSTSAAESALPAFLPSAPSGVAASEEAQADSSSSQTPDTPIVDSVQPALNQPQPPLPVFLPPAETATTGTGYGSPVEVPPARDLVIQRDAAPLSMPTPTPVQPIPGERPTVPVITVPSLPAPTAAPSEPTVEARAAQPPVEHQASELAQSSPRLVPTDAPYSTEPPPMPGPPSASPAANPNVVQRTVPSEVEPPTQSDIVLPTDPELVQDAPAHPLVSSSPTVPPAPHSPSVSERAAPSTGAVSDPQPPLPTDSAAPATAPLSLQRALPPEATVSNQPTQIPAAPLSAASSRVSEVASTDVPTSSVSEELVRQETLNQPDVSAALRPEAEPAPQSSASTSALAESSEPAAISVQRTPLPNREVSVPITEPEAQPPAVSGTPTETPIQRETSREPSAAQVASTDKPATTPMVSAIETPQSSPASSAAPLAQREYAETPNRLESAPSEPAPSAPPVPEALPSNEPTELPAVSPTTSTPSPVQRVLDTAPPQTIPVETNLEAVIPAQPPVDQPAGLSAVSPTTSTPNPVQRVLDTAPFQTIPVETNLEAVIPVQPPIDQRSETPAVNAATSTPSQVQRMLDAAPPQTTPVETNLEAEPPAQSPVDQPRLHALGSEVSVQPEPEHFESPPETQPARAVSSLGSGASTAQRELSAPQPDPTAAALLASNVTSAPSPTALETPALSPEKSASPDDPNPPVQRDIAATEAQSTVEYNDFVNDAPTASLPAEQVSESATLPISRSPEASPVQRAIAATEAQPTVEHNDFVNEATTTSLPAEQVSESATLPISYSPEASPVQREAFTAPDTSTTVIPPQISPPSAAPALEPPLETVTTTPLEAVAQRSVQVESEDQSDVDPAPPTAATAAPLQRAVGQPPIVAAPIKEPASGVPSTVQPPQPTLNTSSSQSAAPADTSARPELTPPSAPTPSLAAPATEVSAAVPAPPTTSTPPNELTVQPSPVTPTEALTESVIEANSSESVGSTAPIPNVTERPQPAIGSPASVPTPINAVEPITTASPTPDISPTETSIQREAQWAADAPASSVVPTVVGTPPLSITENDIAALPTGLTQPLVSLSASDVPEQRAPQSSSPSLDPLVTASLPATAESVLPTPSERQPDATVQRDPASPTANQTPIPVTTSVAPHDSAEPSVSTGQPQPISVPEVSTTLIPESLDRAQAAEAAVSENSSSPEEPVDVFAALQAAGLVSRSVANATTDSPPSADVSMPAWSGEKVEPEGDTGITHAPPRQPPVDVLTALQAMGLIPSAPPRADTRAPAAIQRSPQPDSPTSGAPVIQSEPLTPVLERVISAGDDTDSADSETEFELDDLEIDQLARDVYRILKDRLRIESERARHR